MRRRERTSGGRIMMMGAGEAYGAEAGAGGAGDEAYGGAEKAVIVDWDSRRRAEAAEWWCWIAGGVVRLLP